MSPSRKSVAAAAVLLVGVLGASTPASAVPPNATYTITIGSTSSYAYPTDTPANTYIDKDGTFYFQQSLALYGASDPRRWDFYTGTNLETATKSSAISDAVNPANSNDRNNDTTWRCNNSPTGVESTYAPGTGYSERNYCDLSGVWVDPDTGNWYGLVHNEFTPQPFGASGFGHYDGIDVAVSTNQGKVWTITGHAITSPYSTVRNDTTAFPNQTWDYGDGDQRLFVDTASGYFYAFYGSRINPKAGVGGSVVGLAHVARAPLSSKMATGSWQKWYNGSWSQPGIGGKESNMVPATTGNPNGYTPIADDYSPANTGSPDQQVESGELPPKSDLFVMNIAYDAYLGLYIGTPEVVSGRVAQRYYVTDDLSTQKWYLIGNSGSQVSGSWYRWFLDSVNKTSSTIVGKTFRSYCSIECASSQGEYSNVTVESTSPAPAPIDTTKTYLIGSGSGRILAQVSGNTTTTSVPAATGSTLEAWSFTSLGDGSFRITNASTGQALGVNPSTTTTRAWGTKPTATTLSGSATVGQQWFIIKNTSGGTYRLVNRYSGLVLGMSSDSTRLAETTPTRHWTNGTGNPVGGSRTAAEQTLTLTQTGSTGEVVTVTNPGAQTSTVGTAVSRQISATDSQSKPLTFTATGLPAGLAISSSGLITGTPTTAGTSTVTVTASSGTASGQTTFTWTVNPVGGGCSGTNGNDVAIPDLTTVESSITIAGCAGNASATSTVEVHIVHTYIGDLVVSLVAPDGSTYTLHNRAGGGTDNIDNTYTANVSSEVANGTWKLRVQDAASGDIGTINTWTLNLRGSGGGGRLPQSAMSVKSCDSQELSAENAPCSNVLDGNASTIWHTQWSGTAAPMPHEIQIDLGASHSVTNLYYLPRQSQANGRIGNYEVYVSADGTNWGTAVASGTFLNNTAEQTVTFAAKTGRYVKLRALTEVNGNPWTSVAEINIGGV